jgi:hypothetical protein
MGNKGPKTIKTEIILRLTEDKSGTQRRDTFLSKERAGKETSKVVTGGFLESLTNRRKSLNLKENIENKGSSAFSVEKCLSDLRKEGYLESIPEKVSHPKEYRLKCNNLYDLFRIFYLVYDSDQHLMNKGNNYERLRELVASPYFYEAWQRNIFDIIYYFELWDELVYPISKESYFHMIEDQEFFSVLPISYKLDYTNLKTGGHFKNKKNENRYVGKDYPSYFRNHFPREGPSMYEDYLRNHELQNVLWERLAGLEPNLRIDGFVYLSKFLMKYLGDGFDYESIKISDIDFWFNGFWYGTIEEMVDVFRRYLPWENPNRKLCIAGPRSTGKGYHSYENFKPLIVTKKLVHLSLCSPMNKELDELSYNFIPHSDLMGVFGHYPKFTKYTKLEDPNKPGTFLTDEGCFVIDKVIQSISKDVWFPVSLINFIEYFLQFPCEVSVRPSLTLHDVPVIASKMQIFDKMLKLETGMVSEKERRILLVSGENRNLLISHRISAESNHIERISAWSILFPIHRSFPDDAPLSKL